MAVINRASLAGLVLGSVNPDRLSAWYVATFAARATIVDSVVQLGHSTLIFEQRDDVAGNAAEPGRVIINIEVDSLALFAAQQSGRHVRWVRPIERIPVGLITTLEDADGNLVNVLQLDSTASRGT